MSERPVNFLLFITDQHRADHIGCYGNPIVQTPNLDALAQRGWRSENMHVATPICMPNRASMMTGRYPSAHGARHNGIPLSLEATTFVDRLRQAGYQTGMVGKAHLQNMTDLPPKWPLRPEDRLETEARRDQGGNYDQEKRDLWLKRDDHGMDLPYYGFDKVFLVDDHGDDVHGHYRHWLREHHPEVEAMIGPEAALPSPDYELSKFRQAWRTRVPEDLYPTAYIADRTIDLIEDYAASDRPFFLKCSFPDPHHPFTPPGRFWDMYKPEDMVLPESFHYDGDVPPHVQWLRDQHKRGEAVKTTQVMFTCSERETKEALALNYGSISNIDHQIGRVLQVLQEKGLAENTVVVFTSDHGDFLGDHRLLLKGPIHYRGLTRVPFIWADPAATAGQGGASAALASTVDLAPTILSRAGVRAFNGIQGHDLQRIMGSPDAATRDALIIEEEGQRVILAFDTRVRCRTLLMNDCRLTIYDGVEWGELYDLKRDPHENINLWSDPGSFGLRAAMLEKLAFMMLNQTDTSPYPTALA